MLTIVLPQDDVITRLARLQNQIYWSSHIKIWFDKWGFITNTINDVRNLRDDSYPVFTRAVNLDALDLSSPRGFIEGPVDTDVLEKLCITACVETGVEFKFTFSADISPFGNGYESVISIFGRPGDMLREIPKDNRKKSDPYLLQGARSEVVAYQTFDVPAGWDVIAWVGDENKSNKQKPVIITNGRLILCGMPLLDMICEKLSMPYCDDGYWAPYRRSINGDTERLICFFIARTAVDNGTEVLYLNHWPDNATAAFTIRHDYDRPISDVVLDDLLGFYTACGIKCSFQFLNRLTPKNQIKKILAYGHEIALHTETSDKKKFKNEVSKFNKMMPVTAAGVTCHGGAGSAGHLGAYLYEWAESEGLIYTERLGRDNCLPHPALIPGSETGHALSCMVMAAHLSLDTGTAPEAHLYDLLKKEIPRVLGNGYVVNIMNHPDIHIGELKSLIATLKLDTVWKATHFDIIKWCLISKYQRELTWHGNSPVLQFTEPLPYNLVLDIVDKEQISRRSISSGTLNYNISASQTIN